MGRCPVEYRGNLCICPSVCPSVCLSVLLSVPPSQPASYQRVLDGWMDGWTDGRTDGQTDGFDAQISLVFYRTSSLLGPMPCLLSNCHHYVDGQGKGTADHPLPLGDLFFSLSPLILLIPLIFPTFHLSFFSSLPHSLISSKL